MLGAYWAAPPCLRAGLALGVCGELQRGGDNRQLQGEDRQLQARSRRPAKDGDYSRLRYQSWSSAMVVPIRAGSKLVYRRAMADVNILSHTGNTVYVLVCAYIYTPVVVSA